VTDVSQIYTSAAISAHPLYLDDDGLLLFVLLVGGDYDRGLAHCGPKIATALAQCGFGRDLRRILTTFGGAELQEELGLWREALKAELKSNASGHLDKCYPKLANEVNSSFPNLDVAELYMDPLTSWSSRFSGAAPETSQWIPREPHVDQVSSFCVAHFGWESILLDRLKANFWPGVASRMLFSVRKLCSRLHLSSNDCFQEVPHL
jgi:Holliday junction resolvase YEN1